MQAQQARGFLVGAVVAAVALALLWHFGPWRKPAADPLQQAWDRRAEMRSAAEAAATPPALPVPTRVAEPAPQRASADACAFDPLLRRSSEGDGLFSTDAALDMRHPGGADPFVSIGRDAAAHGRARDAEVSFIVACRLQSRKAQDAGSLAAIQAELGRHYLAVAQDEVPGERKDAILRRARDLLAAASQEPPEARRMAAAAAPTPVRRAESVAARQSRPVAREPAQAAREDRPAEERQAVPPARLLRQDAELARLDADLRRLRSQAGSVTDDPAGFRRRQEAALAQRDACRDRECLLQWYAGRRRALIDEF